MRISLKKTNIFLSLFGKNIAKIRGLLIYQKFISIFRKKILLIGPSL